MILTYYLKIIWIFKFGLIIIVSCTISRFLHEASVRSLLIVIIKLDNFSRKSLFVNSKGLISCFRKDDCINFIVI